MPNSTHELARELPAARAGSAEALGHILEECRGYLLMIAQSQLDAGLQAKGGASDLVQQTMLDAVHDFGQFKGDNQAELHAWLRRLLLNNLTDFARYCQTDKRQVDREAPLDGNDAHTPGHDGLATEISSPSAQAIQGESAQAVQRALQRLPDDYQRAIHLRYFEERTFDEIAQTMQLSPNAARKLWARAVKRFQHELENLP